MGWAKYAQQIGYTDEKLVTFLKDVDSGKKKLGDIGKELGAAGTASQEFGEAVKSAVINMGAMLLVMVAIKGAMWIFDKLNVTTEEQQEIVDDLTEKVKGLKDEYNELYGRNDLTEAEKQKLDYLQRQLTVNEQILKQEQKKLALSKLYGDGDIFSTGELKATGVDSETDSKIQKDIAQLEKLRQQIKQNEANQSGNGIDYVYQKLAKQEAKMVDNLKSEKETILQLQQNAQDNVTLLQEQLDSGALDGDATAKQRVQKDLEFNKHRVDELTEYINNIDATIHVNVETNDVKQKLKAQFGYKNVMEKAQGQEAWSESEMAYLDTLSSEELNYLIDIDSIGTYTLEEVKDFIADFRKEKEKSDKDNTIEFDIKTNLESLESMKDGLDQLKAAYNDVKDGEGFDFGKLIDENFVNKFGGFEDEYNRLLEVVTKSPNDIKACQSAFDDLTSAYIYAQPVMQNITDESYDLTVKWLEQQGVANANEMATYALSQSKQQAFVSTHQLKDGTNEEIQALLNEANAAGFTENEMYSLATAIATADDSSLSFEQQINAIQDIANAAGLASDALNNLITAAPAAISSVDFKSWSANAKNGNLDKYIKQQQDKQKVNNLKTAFNNYLATNRPTQKPTSAYKPSGGSSGSKGSGGKGSGSGSDSKDKYTADIDKYKELSDAVENVKDKIDELNDAYDATDNIDEQISLKNVLIGLYKDEQDALTKLNNARDKEIASNVAQLRQKGFKIDYDAKTDNLIIHNREYLNKLSQSTIKDTEELIKSTEDLNDKNKESLSTWKELNYKISDVNKTINDLQYTKYKNYVADQEHLIELLSNRKDAVGMDISIYGELMNGAFVKWADLVNKGYEVNKEKIQELEKAWKDYYDKRLASEKEILDKQKESKDNALSAVINVIDDKIKSIDDEIDAMKKLNEERQEALDLQQKQADLDKAKNQKTNRVLRKDVGWIDEADEDSVRQAEQAVSDALYEKRINALEKEKEELEDYKNIWQELPNLFEKEQNKLLAAEQIGANWERNVLDQRLDVYNKFKNEYIGIQQALKANTDETENHLNETYVNMMKVFELMYKMNTPKNEDHDSWYVQKNGKAPSQAKKGDFIYTNGGTYRITGKDANGNFTREKVDNVNSHIKENQFGTKLPKDVIDSVSGITDSNKKIIDASDKRLQEDKRQILATQGLNAVLNTNGKITNENIVSLLENIVSTDDNTKSNEQVATEVRMLCTALANFSLVDKDEEQKVTVDKFDDSIMSDSDRAYIKSIQAAWNEAMRAGNKELADTLHEMAENVRDKYRSTSEFDYQLKDVAQAGVYQYASGYVQSGSYNIGGANADAEATKKYLENLKWLKDKVTKIDENTGQTVGSKEFIDRLDRVEDIVKNGEGLTSTVQKDDYGRIYTEIKEKGTGTSSNAPSAGSKKTDSLSKSDSDAIKAAQKAYNEAKAKGDTAGMNKAHADAEAVRNKNGYSGGSDGSKVIERSNKDVSKNLKNNSNSIDKNSDSSSDNTKATEANTKELQKGISVNVSVSGVKGGSSGGGGGSNGSSGGRGSGGGGYKVDNNPHSPTFGVAVKKKAKGGLNLVAGTYNVDEIGDELIINPKEGRYVELQTGSSVIPADVSQRLWEFGANPEKYITDISPAVRISVPTSDDSPNQIVIQNMVAHLPAVHDANDFMKTLPAKAKQFITDRTLR